VPDRSVAMARQPPSRLVRFAVSSMTLLKFFLLNILFLVFGDVIFGCILPQNAYRRRTFVMEDVQDQAERIFATLVGLDPSERKAYLDDLCQNSPSLRIRVEQMLKDDENAGSFLIRPLLDPGRIGNGPSLEAPASEPVGQHPDAPQFRPNDVIASRFAIRQFIARGGMGEVYEVEDTHLRGVHVALKTILSHYALDPVMRERFKREVLMAREVVHPHVCPIYDLFEWKRPEGLLVFLTMKLLEGETVAARLRRLGALPLEEVRLIAHQVASGLAAAHNAGILHRDIKPANISLTTRDGAIHTYVTDFGLARPFIDETTALTAGIAGTPGFMAPELYHGVPPSKASDVYSMGVVVYQMLTGFLPSPVKPDVAREKGDNRRASIPQEWKAILERALQPDPAARFRDIPEFARSLPSSAAEGVGRPSQFWNISRRKILGLAGATVAATGMGAWVERQYILNLFHPLPANRFVALIAWPVNNASSVTTTILDAVSARLVSAEATVRNFVIYSSRDWLYTSIAVHAPTDAGTALGATLVLTASLVRHREADELNLQLIDVATSVTLRQQVAKFATNQIGSIEEKASEIASNMLGIPMQDKPMQDMEEMRRLPPEVLQIFSQAREAADKANGTGLETAIGLYQKVIDLEPHFALGYAELAFIYIRRFLGSGDMANVDLARGNSMLALRYNQGSAKALLSVALVCLYSGESKEAVAAFSKALSVDPGNSQILFYQAQAYRYLNQPGAAEDVYRKIITERPNYWQAYNELGYMLSQQGKHEEAAEAFRRAIAAAPSVALPEANLGSEYMLLGKAKEAVDACQRSIQKNPNDAAYRTMGDIAFMNGEYKSAKSHYQKAAELDPTNHDTWRDIGDCDAMLGNPAGVRSNYERAADALQAVMPKSSQSAYGWATLAFYFAKTGHKEQAELALSKAGPRRSGNLGTQIMIIQAVALLGKREEALELLLSAVDQGLTPLQVEGSLDLSEIRKDPRYLSRIAKLQKTG
jgi:tetratricopeptide (TPR) repeat protein/tRNA A-37 threonylcarbamoyl transferase component Bud32